MNKLPIALLLASATALGLGGCMKDQPHDSSSGEQSPGYGAKAGQYVDDSALTTNVKAALAAHDSLSTLAIHVDSDKGVVTISGTVHSQDQYTQVAQIAQSVEGVRSVNNQLNVKTGE
jgi:hyperosmotically inducible protein